MASTSARQERATRGVEFALDSFDVADGRLVVAGRWYGVTGRRFVRPVLQEDGQRRLIAVLDHKPWSAEEGGAWLAAFPHDKSVGPSRLQVAPDIAIELPAAGPEVGDGVPRPARVVRADAAPRARAPKRQTPRRAERAEEERDAALLQVEALRREKDEARGEADRVRVEFDQARRTSERLESELGHARTDLARLTTELSRVRAEANTLRIGSEGAAAKLDRLEAEVSRLRGEAHRATAERSAAQSELDRVRRTPPQPRGPYIAPRPVTMGQLEPRPNWPLRLVAGVIVIVVLAVLVQLLFGVV